jgi:hypothetical protein
MDLLSERTQDFGRGSVMGSLLSRLVSTVATLGAIVAALVIAAPSAYAVPGFARQTGLACEACHTIFPELTPFGRQFKLNAYVFSNTPKVSDINEKRESTLSIGAIPPFSVQIQGSLTSLGHSIPDSGVPANITDLAQKNSAQLPQSLSLFYTGEIADNFGAFIQVTWDPTRDSIGIDNTDLRFSDNTMIASRPVVYGLTLNNNPTSQDVWNSTPAWGFPFLTSNVVPTPAASALIDASNLGGQAAGAGGYLWIDNHLYIELAGYRSAHTNFTNNTTGGPGPADSTSEPNINGTAPYWRLGWEQNWQRNSLFFGTYGIHARTNSGGVGFHGPTSSVTDYAFDAQYQWIGEDHIFTANGTWIHEDSSQGNTSELLPTPFPLNSSNHLDTKRLTANYFYKRRYGGAIQYFDTTGSTDLGLFTPSPVGGSRNGSPDSRGLIFEVNYLPWLNTKISLQYTAYFKFNGSSTDYDGSGRSASDNNTLFLSLWTAF